VSRAVLPSELLHEPGTMAYSGAMTNASGTNDKPSACDPLPPKCSVIEVRVGELKQLFNAIDPSPFRDKDLDLKAEEFIVGWAKDLPRDTTLALVVDLDRELGYRMRLLFFASDSRVLLLCGKGTRHNEPDELWLLGTASLKEQGPAQGGRFAKMM
jgi:hypothetical protein